MKRKEPTVSIRISESDYDILIGVMGEAGLATIRDAVSYCVNCTIATASKEITGDLPDGRPPVREERD